jgi:hypothetical protein
LPVLLQLPAATGNREKPVSLALQPPSAAVVTPLASADGGVGVTGQSVLSPHSGFPLLLQPVATLSFSIASCVIAARRLRISNDESGSLWYLAGPKSEKTNNPHALSVVIGKGNKSTGRHGV